MLSERDERWLAQAALCGINKEHTGMTDEEIEYYEAIRKEVEDPKNKGVVFSIPASYD